MKNFLKKSESGSLSVPVAIIIAGLIIGLAVVYAVGSRSVGPANPPADNGAPANVSLDNIKPVSSEDHIFGPANAPVKIVEYSDTECPFCKRFHETLQQVIKDYNGQVAWVYRYFPLATLHSRAPKEAESAECAAQLGGNEKFWIYLNRLYSVTPSNDDLDPAELPNIAAYAGLNVAAFNACLSSGKNAGIVQAQYDEAVSIGGQGTPYSIVISKSGKKSTINGALPLASVKKIVDEALAE